MKKSDKQLYDDLEKEIEDDFLLQEKMKNKFVDELFSNGDLLVNEIEIKKTKKEKSILKKLLDFLFGF